MNTFTRLHSFSDKLADLFSRADLNHQRRAALSACMHAIKLSQFTETEVHDAVQNITSESEQLKSTLGKIDKLTNKYDDLYFSEVDKCKGNINKNAKAFFLKARALSSLNIYLSKNDSELDDVLYEALLSTDDTSAMLKLIVNSLSNQLLNHGVVEKIGCATKAGNPVARERSALDDIENVTGVRPGYTSYSTKKP